MIIEGLMRGKRQWKIVNRNMRWDDTSGQWIQIRIWRR